MDFKKLVSARFFFTFAVQMQAVILGWRIYDLLKDPLYLGFIGLTEAIPAIGFALYAGYLVDRLRPLMVYRRVIFVSLLSGLVVLAEHLFAHDMNVSTQVGLLYFAAFLTGLARAFSQPAIFAIVPRLVERGLLMRASAVSSSVMQVARIGGPAVGGLIFGFWGPVASSSIVCILLVIASVSLMLIRKDLPAPEQTVQHASIKDELLSGGKFVFKHPILLPALSLDMISVLFGGVTALLPIFANEILFVGPKGLGILRAAPAIGATMMSLYLSRTNGMRTGRWLLSAVTGFGFCILVFGLSTNFYLSVAALALSGSFDSISMVIRSAAVQLSSPDHMRGKISAVNSIFIGSSNEIGELESGIAAKLLGTVPAVYFGGIMCILTVGLIGYLSPSLRKLDLEKLQAT
ncbi:MFS transporter [Bdellovibrio bacteriovorus]|uniref:MFS transporter n=1 Tax=Bdellovibrio bacteriovorus TaxID=959 RepID=UPI00155F0563|nr:MFS transporter [Bdellovibrio bacteriovorus]